MSSVTVKSFIGCLVILMLLFVLRDAIIVSSYFQIIKKYFIGMFCDIKCHQNFEEALEKPDIIRF